MIQTMLEKLQHAADTTVIIISVLAILFCVSILVGMVQDAASGDVWDESDRNDDSK